ncbi:MAG TPA: DNA-binding response regulator [Flavobacteriales bacterium]|nr:DNA-binding response regulator [Flavobacteriales bacterium]HCA83950.1 DNA-binding response regulator [Flavobacteriales bacterium]
MIMRCIIVDDDELSRNIMEDLVREHEHLELVKTCSSAIEAFNVLKTEEVDLIFLDVDMPKMSGMDLIRSLEVLPQVILITSHAEYAAESYEYSVTDFVVKPISHGRFLKAVEKAQKNLSRPNFSSETSKTIFIKSDSRLVQVQKSNILYIEALGNYVNVYTAGGKFIVLSTMKDIESRLTSPDFMRVHRSFIVRLDKIDSIEDNFIHINQKNIPIGKNYKDELMRSLNML